MEDLLGCEWEILMAYVINRSWKLGLDQSLCPYFFFNCHCLMQSVVFVIQSRNLESLHVR